MTSAAPRRRPIFMSLAALTVCALALTSCSGGGKSDDAGTALPPTSITAPLDRMYRFDAEGELPIVDRSELPIEPGRVTARWYMFGGWLVALLDGLNVHDARPVCLRTSLLNADSNQLEHVSVSPTGEGACDGGAAGVFVPPAIEPTGMRACNGVASFVTNIGAEQRGSLFATVTFFPGNGTGIEVSGRADASGDLPPEIDPGYFDCAPLPAVRTIPTRTPEPTPPPTAVPASTASVPADKRVRPPPPTDPGECAPAEAGLLQDIIHTNSAPYFVHHPAADDPDVATIVFLPGGAGRRGSAERIWDIVFADSPKTDGYRIVIPYSFDADFIDEAARTTAIVNEVLWCYGGDPARVHLAGTSNGGLAAFGLMTGQPELFATLLGAPGAFPVQDPSEIEPEVWAETLAGRAVFNGVGTFDEEWKPEVIATHNTLAAAGIESIYFELPAQGHAMTEEFDEQVFFDFWSTHPRQ